VDSVLYWIFALIPALVGWAAIYLAVRYGVLHALRERDEERERAKAVSGRPAAPPPPAPLSQA
jgi:hypothetical protein